jgi:hypothetical protein
MDEDLGDVTLAMQVAAAKREVALRASAYPKWIESGRLNPDEAERETRAMRAVLKTLLILEREVAADTAPELSFFQRGPR